MQLANKWGKVLTVCSRCFREVYVMAEEERGYVCASCEFRERLEGERG